MSAHGPLLDYDKKGKMITQIYSLLCVVAWQALFSPTSKKFSRREPLFQLDLSFIKDSIRGASCGTEGDRIVDRLSDVRSRSGLAESGDSCGGKIFRILEVVARLSVKLEWLRCAMVVYVLIYGIMIDMGNLGRLARLLTLRFDSPAEMLRDLDQQMEKRADDGKANVVTDALSRKERVKPRRVRAMAMIIQYGVRGMILAAQSEAFKQENGMMRTVVMDEAHASRLRWMIYLVVLADAVESVRDTIGFDYHSSIWCAPFKALYGRKCRWPVLWAEIGESSLIGYEFVQETTNKVVLIKEKLKAVRDRQKSCTDSRRKPLEFEVGERVMLNVSPWKGVIRFGKKGLHVPLDEIKVDKTLHFVEEPVENSDREVKRLKCSRMVVVKVHLGLKRGYVRFGNQSIERGRLTGIGFVLDFVDFISFTFGDKEMISVIEAVSR
ncbi:hypothetical protein Tco_0589847 [Tanacetum coccineum]